MTKNLFSQNFPRITYLLCLTSGILFSKGISTDSLIIQNAAGVYLTAFLLLLSFLNFRFFFDSKEFPKSILVQIFILSMTIVVGAFIFKAPQESFWVPDSYTTHLPESVRFSQFFLGQKQITWEELNALSGRTTQFFTGIAITFFGKNIIATTLVQTLFKLISCICVYHLAKSLWKDNKIALGSLLIYASCPTVFFYTNVLYKEGAVQALFALAILSWVKIYKEKKAIYFVFLVLSLILLINERFYVAILTFIGITGLFLNDKLKSEKKALGLFFTLGIIVGTITYFLMPEHFQFIIDKIKQQREYHSSFNDVVNQFNYQIPYPVALIKILFSPYFTLNKFNIFIGFSNILIWGSFINQGIILTSLLGFYRSLKTSLQNFYLMLPFFIFLLMAAYISPWSGRIRDSFYPIIACYASYFIVNNKLFKQLVKKN